jgi:hypothetical protein
VFHCFRAIFRFSRQEVGQEYDKDFDFLKQHSLSHATGHFRSKGTSRNMNTRVGEGFQQEVAKMYVKTNGKNAEHQVRTELYCNPYITCEQICVLDENEETMARLKMAVDEWRRGQVEVVELDLISSATLDSGAHWTLGAPDSQISSHGLESSKTGDAAFRNFNLRLREYLAHHHPLHAVRFEDEIKVNSVMSASGIKV